VVFIARGDAYADALAGTPAAATDGGPVLLVSPDAIPPATATELTRLKPAKIIVLGGTLAVSDQVVSGLAAFTTGSVTRIAGADRYQTAADISAATFAPGVPAAFIATDLGFADALAGGAAAGLRKSPILITSVDAIPSATAAELTRLKPASIVILGGIGAVSDAVATQLAAYTTGAVTREAGADRIATAVAVSQASFPNTAAAVYLATGFNFPDALAGGVAAALAPGPLLLVSGDCLPAPVSAEITRLDPAKVFILGGPLAVGPNVASLSVCTSPPPPASTSTSTAAPTTSTTQASGPTCTASVSDPTPAGGGSETISITSNQPNAAISVTAHYATVDHTFTGTTDTTGSGSVTFSIGHPTSGFTVDVDVTVGAASCSTSFTPQ